jgi:hypothetical protein
MADNKIENNAPETLIKYYECNEYSCDALKNNYLWATDPLTFNDPFDCSKKTWNKESFTIECLKNHIKDFDPILPQFSERDKMISLLLSKTGIICLNNNDEQYEDLFWGYYSKQKGFSITFRRKILSQNLSTNFFEKVNYKETNKFKIIDLPNTKIEFLNAIINWSTQKKIIWKPENEWRYIFFDIEWERQETRIKYYNPDCILQITLGLRFFGDNLEEISGEDEAFIYNHTKESNPYHYQLLKHLIENPQHNVW